MIYFSDLKQYFRDDLLAGFSASLVALPLALGIALASGVPPMAGVWSALAGGFVTTWFRGSALAINGPAAGLIVIILAGIEALKDETWISGFQYVLAATVLAGIFQVLLGLLRAGKYADWVPASVISGMLAAIGVIISTKQLYPALGLRSDATTIFNELIALPQQLFSLNPYVSLISIISLCILLIHARIQWNWVQRLPAPIWLVFFSIIFVFYFNFFEPHQAIFLSTVHELGPHLLVQLPTDISASVLLPNFSKFGNLDFWLLVLTLTVIASIQTLVIAKAVDQLDPAQRRTKMNKELMAVGLGNILAGCIGGLPLIAVIVRSKVNIQNGAKTAASNFYHALFILLFVACVPMLIQLVPLAALAVLLVYAGVQLASPAAVLRVYKKGWEQLLIFAITLILTLAQDLLIGLLSGMLATFLIQWFRSRLGPLQFIRHQFSTQFKHIPSTNSADYTLEVEGILNFFNILQLKTALRKAPSTSDLTLDLSRTKLIDNSVLEYLQKQAELYDVNASSFQITGLEHHQKSTNENTALHVLP